MSGLGAAALLAAIGSVSFVVCQSSATDGYGRKVECGRAHNVLTWGSLALTLPLLLRLLVTAVLS